MFLGVGEEGASLRVARTVGEDGESSGRVGGHRQREDRGGREPAAPRKGGQWCSSGPKQGAQATVVKSPVWAGLASWAATCAQFYAVLTQS